jgi:hypothetical protein
MGEAVPIAKVVGGRDVATGTASSLFAEWWNGPPGVN